MQRILVMGCSGAGKTTFARRLASKLSVPFVSVDALYWQPGWVEADKAEFTAAMRREADRDAWIMDGNFTQYDRVHRLSRAQAIFWFDLPTMTCLTGALWRFIANYGTVRPEMTPGCPERIDWTHLKYIASFREKKRPGLLNLFTTLRDDQTFVTFRTRREADDYFDGMGRA